MKAGKSKMVNPDPTVRRGSDLTGGPSELRPIPDPTVLTTAQLLLAISNLREYMETLIEGRLSAVDTRFTESEKAVKLLQDFANKSPTIDVVDGRIIALAALHSERMSRIEEIGKAGFEERERLSVSRLHSLETKIETNKQSADERFRLGKESTDSAFITASENVRLQNDYFKESMGRIEQLFTKQIEGALVTISDLKDRVNSMSGHTRGTGDSWAVVGFIVMALIAGAAVIVDLVRH